MFSTGRKLLALAFVPAAVLAGLSPTPTAAAWVDSESATAVLTAGQIDPPIDLQCDDDLLLSSARMTWSAPSTGVAPSGYTVVLSRRGILVPDGTRTFVVPSGRTFFDISPELLVLGDYTVTIYSTRNTWVSEPSVVWVVDVNVSVLGVGFTSCEGRLLDLI